ncbi:hypothetical protein [Actinoplanes awajinensis]|uniref:Uncharacterized protein n=1 Tax=Actinoplanes awajinensis subsp. mycoplanecinus TaxID=135947 RepID=A0A101JTD0_9ACTN|nr:hypothetical protein [Actinoplanes awajinensis]KUL32657.1 hypothetical protein ADL15_19265 [Actinoplanes awajinensis subsp. mycoplanecinus]
MVVAEDESEDGDMSDDQHEHVPAGNVYVSAAAAAPHRRALRRKQALVGVAGAAALLAGAGFLAAQLMEPQQETLPEPAALAPPATVATPGIEGTGQSVVPGDLPAPRTTYPADPARRTPSPTPSDLQTEIDASVAAGGFPQAASPSAAQGQSGPVTRRVETVRNGTVRVSSARFDLSDKGDRRLAADQGRLVADGVHCTNRVRFEEGETAVVRDGLLLCWRTSDQRSVVTMAIVKQGVPDTADSVAVIEREWAALD